MRETPTTSITEVLLESLDAVLAMHNARCGGLADAEFLWEPVPDCWTVRSNDSGGWLVDLEKPEPEPRPVPTIGWRMWHIAVDCFEGYSAQAFGTSGTELTGREWVGTAAPALEVTGAAIGNFRAGVAAAGDVNVWDLLGPNWGPFQNHSLVDLVLHAQHELAHHSAEIALLRDLYDVRQSVSR